jgi:tRNA threonylcarbamoyladenosine biosynthesis protein TsaB
MFIEQLLAEAQVKAWKLDAVAFSQGPGSYTGLRIGASLAKGLCYGLNIPFIPVDTLQILCAAATMKQLPQDAILCPMLDARRMEVYTSIYTREGMRTRDIEAKIIDEHSFAEELNQNTIYFFGNGADKCKKIIHAKNAHFIDNIVPQMTRNRSVMTHALFHLCVLRLETTKSFAGTGPIYTSQNHLHIHISFTLPF